VLRSREWRAWCANDYAMEQEVATQAAKSYSLPLEVVFFEDHLVGSDACYGTIHSLKLKLHTRHATPTEPDSLLPSNWSWERLSHQRQSAPGPDFGISVVDMLIEVHGRGLCGSEHALRRVLADALNERMVLTPFGAKLVCGTKLDQYFDDDGAPEGGQIVDDDGQQMPLRDLLEYIAPVTRVGDFCMKTHRITHQNERGRDRWCIDLLHVCGNYPGVIT